MTPPTAGKERKSEKDSAVLTAAGLLLATKEDSEYAN